MGHPEETSADVTVGRDGGEVSITAGLSDVRHVFRLPPAVARAVAADLTRNADLVDADARRAAEDARIAALPPVDRTATTLTDGNPVTPDHRDIDPATGQQKGYVVLSADERAKGFVRPVRRTYTHRACGTTTTMGASLAETYARDPKFYGGTFCCQCSKHFPLDQFVWTGTDEQVGS